MNMERSEGSWLMPRVARIESVQDLGPREKMFRLVLSTDERLGHEPGQFVEVVLPSIGSAPISIACSDDASDGAFELAVRAVPEGVVTNAMHKLRAGDTLHVRGPYGKGFPIDAYRGRSVIMIAGGIGLFPLRSLWRALLRERHAFKDLAILFGTNTANERYFPDELDELAWRSDIIVKEALIDPPKDWKGHTGYVTGFLTGSLHEIVTDAAHAAFVVVGPPAMYRPVIRALHAQRIPSGNIWASFERRMHCAVGKCGACQIGPYYCCKDGPVFRIDEVEHLNGVV